MPTPGIPYQLSHHVKHNEEGKPAVGRWRGAGKGAGKEGEREGGGKGEGGRASGRCLETEESSGCAQV